VGVAALLCVAYLAICLFAATMLTAPPRNVDPERTPARFGQAYRDVQFASRTPGLELAGWYLENATGDRALVLVHGHTSSRSTEFKGRFVDLVVGLHRRGFTVLAFDLRGHGQSDPARTGFGALEHADVAGAIDWLRAQGFAAERSGVLGVSMGGMAAIRAVADEPEIAALATDSTPPEVLAVVQREWPNASGLPDFFLPTTLLAARLQYGLDLTAAPALTTLPRVAPRPVLLIHGAADSLVPLPEAELLAAALPNAERWIVPGAAHAEGFLADPTGYTARVGDFFARHIP
jgi:pimeloyl-ACP methyl ester carboxylesterase